MTRLWRVILLLAIGIYISYTVVLSILIYLSISMRKATGILLGVIAAILFVGVFLNEKVEAAAVSPDKYYVDVNNVGETKNQILTIYGDPRATEPIKLYLGVYGMKKVGEENDRTFYLPDPNNAFDAANWVKLNETSININPTEQYKLGWRLEPGVYTSCGTNYAGIYVSEKPIGGLNPDESIVSVSNVVISQVHVNVNKTIDGECTNNAVVDKLVEFKVDRFIPIFNYDEVPFLTRIQNDGNLISRSPVGFIEVFGLGPKITIPFNEEALDIYPGTTRKFENKWVEDDYPRDGNFFDKLGYEIIHFRIGLYKARLGVTQNINPQIVAYAYFFVLPWRILLIILLILFLLFVYTRFVVNNTKKKTNKKD